MNSWEYTVVDLFMHGMPAADIAEKIHKNTMEVMEILTGTEARAYREKLTELKRLELEALADGPAMDVMRAEVESGGGKEAVNAADKIWKAAGKYEEKTNTVATLAEILKRVMDDNADKKTDV